MCQGLCTNYLFTSLPGGCIIPLLSLGQFLIDLIIHMTRLQTVKYTYSLRGTTLSQVQKGQSPPITSSMNYRILLILPRVLQTFNQCSGGKKFKTTFQLWFGYAEQICPQLHSGYHVPLWTQPKGGPVASCAINEVFNSDANMRLFLEVNSVYILPSFFNMLFSHLGGV